MNMEKRVRKTSKVKLNTKLSGDELVIEQQKIPEIEKHEPTFEDQLYGMSFERTSDMKLTSTDRQWLQRKDDSRDSILKADIKGYVDDSYAKTSRILCKQMSDIVSAEWKFIFDSLEKQESLLSDIKGTTDSLRDEVGIIKSSISGIKLEISNMKKELNDLEIRHDRRLRELEKIAETPIGIVELITEIKRFMLPRNRFTRFAFTSIVIIIVALIIHHYFL